MLLLATVLMATAAKGDGWQGTGNMNNSVISTIWDNMAINLYPILPTGDISSFGQNLSAILNKEWDPAWNVVVFVGPTGYDAILYGYAFNNHWMWYNGVPSKNVNDLVTLIVWKDYNCKDWKKIGIS